MKIPEGYVLCRRGGRPPKHARDMAVFLMKVLMVDHRGGKASIFEREAAKLFGLPDTPDVRKSVRKAKQLLARKPYILVHINPGAIFIFPAPPNYPGQKGWAWGEGMTEALPMRVQNAGLTLTNHPE